MKKMAYLLLAGIVCLSVAGCSGEKEKPAAVVVDPNAKVLKLVAKNYAFDQEEYKVKKGEPITLQLDIQDGVHGISIEGFDAELDYKTTAATITPDTAGTYAIRCSIPCGTGHGSMTAKLVVEE
ncbi:MAG: cytochrome C oxidase subunit II [Clostridia bacterium]